MRQIFRFDRSAVAALAGAALLAPCLVQPARAQDPASTVESIVSALSSEAAGEMVRTLKAGNALNLKAAEPIPSAFQFPSYATSVDFEEDSTILSTKGMATLRTVAAALTDERLAGATFQVAAHVEVTSGGDMQALSTKRAAVVSAHLATFYGIEQDRLVPVGYGATKLLDPSAPQSSQNDRIEIVNVEDLTE